MTRFRSVGCAWKASCTISIQLRVTSGHLVSVYGKYSHLPCNHILEWRTKRSSSLSKMEICWVAPKILRTVFTTWWDNVGTESQNNDLISTLYSRIFIRFATIMILGEDPKRTNLFQIRYLSLFLTKSYIYQFLRKWQFKDFLINVCAFMC